MSLKANQTRIQLCDSHKPKLHGGGCCNDKGAEKLLEGFRTYIKENQLEGRIEIVESGCLRNCLQGPSLRILPDMTLYSRVKIQDIAEIVEEHLLNGNPVKRLKTNQISIVDQF